MIKKDIVTIDLTTAVDTAMGSYDDVEFTPTALVLLTETPRTRYSIFMHSPAAQKLVMGPTGSVYPGDDIPGTGSKKVTITLNSLLEIIFDGVEVAENTGWLVITKGEFTVIYSPVIIEHIYVELST